MQLRSIIILSLSAFRISGKEADNLAVSADAERKLESRTMLDLVNEVTKDRISETELKLQRINNAAGTGAVSDMVKDRQTGDRQLMKNKMGIAIETKAKIGSNFFVWDSENEDLEKPLPQLIATETMNKNEFEFFERELYSSYGKKGKGKGKGGNGKKRRLDDLADESEPETGLVFFDSDLPSTASNLKENDFEFFERELYSSYGKKGKGKGGKKGSNYSYSYGKKRRELVVADETVPETEHEFLDLNFASDVLEPKENDFEFFERELYSSYGKKGKGKGGKKGSNYSYSYGKKRRELVVADETVPETRYELLDLNFASDVLEPKENDFEFFERELYSSYGKKGKGKGGKKGSNYSYSYGKKRRELVVADESVPETEHEFLDLNFASNLLEPKENDFEFFERELYSSYGKKGKGKGGKKGGYYSYGYGKKRRLDITDESVPETGLVFLDSELPSAASKLNENNFEFFERELYSSYGKKGKGKGGKSHKGGKRRELVVADEAIPEHDFFDWNLAFDEIKPHQSEPMDTVSKSNENEFEFFERELYSSYGKKGKGKGKGGKKGGNYSYSYGKKRRQLVVADETVPENENEFFAWNVAFEGVKHSHAKVIKPDETKVNKPDENEFEFFERELYSSYGKKGKGKGKGGKKGGYYSYSYGKKRRQLVVADETEPENEFFAWDMAYEGVKHIHNDIGKAVEQPKEDEFAFFERELYSSYGKKGKGKGKGGKKGGYYNYSYGYGKKRRQLDVADESVPEAQLFRR